jgi:hypothetical protein
MVLRAWHHPWQGLPNRKTVLCSVSERTIIDRNYLHGGAAPFFSVVDAVGAVVVLAGGTPYENVGTVVAENVVSWKVSGLLLGLLVALSFFSSGFPSLFAVAPKFPKSPPPVVALCA